MCICIHSFIFISIYTHFWGTHHYPNQKQGGKHVINAIRELQGGCAGGGQQTPFEMGIAITGVMRPSRGRRNQGNISWSPLALLVQLAPAGRREVALLVMRPLLAWGCHGGLFPGNHKKLSRDRKIPGVIRAPENGDSHLLLWLQGLGVQSTPRTGKSH